MGLVKSLLEFQSGIQNVFVCFSCVCVYSCVGLNKYGPHMFRYLNVWFPSGETVWEALVGVTLSEEVWPC